MHIIDTEIDPLLLELYKDTVDSHFHRQLAAGNPVQEFYPTRNVRLCEEDEIVTLVKDILESKLRVKLTLSEAELQTWYAGSYSTPHNHQIGRPDGEDYNSLLYLNDDFDDGLFYTEDGLVVQPRPGRLTFFDGKNITHGVTPIKTRNRYTAIFWWKNTQFI